MKTQLAAPVAAILLLLGSAPLIAGELPFNAPSTQSARENTKLLHRAAHALYDSAPDATRIADLWLFPTNDANTVFAQYTLKTNAFGVSSAEHLAVLTLQGDRIVGIRELTDVAVGRPGDEAGSLDWTAMIGTGGTTKPGTGRASVARGPADWTAKIGTGSAAAANSGSKAAAIVARVAAFDPTRAAAPAR